MWRWSTALGFPCRTSGRARPFDRPAPAARPALPTQTCRSPRAGAQPAKQPYKPVPDVAEPHETRPLGRQHDPGNPSEAIPAFAFGMWRDPDRDEAPIVSAGRSFAWLTAPPRRTVREPRPTPSQRACGRPPLCHALGPAGNSKGANAERSARYARHPCARHADGLPAGPTGRLSKRRPRSEHARVDPLHRTAKNGRFSPPNRTRAQGAPRSARRQHGLRRDAAHREGCSGPNAADRSDPAIAVPKGTGLGRRRPHPGIVPHPPWTFPKTKPPTTAGEFGLRPSGEPGDRPTRSTAGGEFGDGQSTDWRCCEPTRALGDPQGCHGSARCRNYVRPTCPRCESVSARTS